MAKPLHTAFLSFMHPAMSRLKELGVGFGALLRGFIFLAGRPRLWIWAILPTMVNLLLLGLMVGVSFHYYGDLYGWLISHIGLAEIAAPETWWQHLLNALIFAAGLVLKALIVLLTLVLLLLFTYALSFVVAGPFNDALSERVEQLLTGAEPPPFALKKFVADLWRTVRVELIKAGILLAIPVALFVVSFIPVVGGPLYLLLTFAFGAWDLGFSYADLPYGRRAAPFRTRWAFARSNRFALMGLGAGFAIPFFALLFAAPMVAGGTILFVEKQGASALRPEGASAS